MIVNRAGHVSQSIIEIRNIAIIIGQLNIIALLSQLHAKFGNILRGDIDRN